MFFFIIINDFLFCYYRTVPRVQSSRFPDGQRLLNYLRGMNVRENLCFSFMSRVASGPRRSMFSTISCPL